MTLETGRNEMERNEALAATREALAAKLERWAENQPDPKIAAIQREQAAAARRGDMRGVFGR
jgi:hypothetical protein